MASIKTDGPDCRRIAKATQSRRRDVIMQEASVALLITRIRPARRQTCIRAESQEHSQTSSERRADMSRRRRSPQSPLRGGDTITQTYRIRLVTTYSRGIGVRCFRGERHGRVIVNGTRLSCQHAVGGQERLHHIRYGESCRRKSVYARLRLHDDTDCRCSCLIPMPIRWTALYPGDTKRLTCSVDAEQSAGIRVKDTPKIQTIEPTKEDHSIYFPETDFRIPLSLWGMFSYFVTSKPTAMQMMESEDVYLLTPSRMNPNCDSYVTNEENMLDWEGHMTCPR
jgi:hypothetical protein